MTFDYTKTAATVARLIDRFGATSTLTTVTAGTMDPATGAMTGGTTTTRAVRAVVFDFEGRQEGAQFAPGTLILAGDKQVYMAVPSVAPAPGDTFPWEGVTYRVVACRKLAPSGVAVMYELLVRR